jgi:hypothetical protein
VGQGDFRGGSTRSGNREFIDGPLPFSMYRLYSIFGVMVLKGGNEFVSR